LGGCVGLDVLHLFLHEAGQMNMISSPDLLSTIIQRSLGFADTQVSQFLSSLSSYRKFSSLVHSMDGSLPCADVSVGESVGLEDLHFVLHEVQSMDGSLPCVDVSVGESVGLDVLHLFLHEAGQMNLISSPDCVSTFLQRLTGLADTQVSQSLLSLPL
jgi:hypothetical protein